MDVAIQPWESDQYCVAMISAEGIRSIPPRISTRSPTVTTAKCVRISATVFAIGRRSRLAT